MTGYKFRALPSGSKRGYDLIDPDGRRVGTILTSYRRTYGGDCWEVVIPGPAQASVYFYTRKEAALFLIQSRVSA